jgi:hypothetical protein
MNAPIQALARLAIATDRCGGLSLPELGNLDMTIPSDEVPVQSVDTMEVEGPEIGRIRTIEINGRKFTTTLVGYVKGFDSWPVWCAPQA